jgi:hypothetical protein
MEALTPPIEVTPDGRVDTKNASLFLDLSVKTLAMMRTNGTGPKFIKPGRVYYYMDDLIAWLGENEKATSTAQARLQRRKA